MSMDAQKRAGELETQLEALEKIEVLGIALCRGHPRSEGSNLC